MKTGVLGRLRQASLDSLDCALRLLLKNVKVGKGGERIGITWSGPQGSLELGFGARIVALRQIDSAQAIKTDWIAWTCLQVFFELSGRVAEIAAKLIAAA